MNKLSEILIKIRIVFFMNGNAPENVVCEMAAIFVQREMY